MTHAAQGGRPLSALLRQAVADADGHRIGVLDDLAVRLRPGDYPLVTGLVVSTGATRAFVTAAGLGAVGSGRVGVAVHAVDPREFLRKEGVVLLSQDVLRLRLIDLRHAAFVNAYDVQLAPVPEGWAATGLDVLRRRWLRPGPHRAPNAPRDWKDFEPLIGHADSAEARAAASRISHLTAAQITGIIQEATGREQRELLAQLRGHPDLEADVFEELDRPV
jgi:sporulation protein YlmC with PRC-barrel domain